MDNEYSKVGLRAGLEIHQQLNTKEKLFCPCKPVLFSQKPEFTFIRKLRPAQSELGQVDSAALFEFQKEKKILYEANNESTCLVEMDEEPPHGLNTEAIEISVIASLMMKMKPVDEIHVMRKMVIDGSNTTGFQRTCVIALNGKILIDNKKIAISQVSLEEDAARKTGKDQKMIHYRIDRLGIPLIEVTTAPVIYSPEEAQETAAAIGRILRATRKVRRGLGTIRQDVNVSIRDGALIEIKGVQELELISQVIKNEVNRQKSLLQIRNQLNKIEIKEGDIIEEFIDVTKIFKETKCKVISKAIKQKKLVLALKLPGFEGLLKKQLAAKMRLGSELAEIARFWGRVGGIFHTDEMPAYGITKEELNQLGKLMKKESKDAIVFVADKYENSIDALKAVVHRAKAALKGVPEETRSANPDGTTKYMRPRPGAARMYPETDVPPIQLKKEYLDYVSKNLPEFAEQLNNRLKKEYNLNQKLALQIIDSEYLELFEIVATETKISPTLIAVTFTETLKALKREGTNIENITDDQYRKMFQLIDSEKTAKESIPEILNWIAKNKNANPNNAIESLGLHMISKNDIEKLIDKIIEENSDFIKKRGKNAFGPIMGLIMKEARGRVKPQTIKNILKTRLN
jgi:glutamyl-tRNA(Gln) amidotransferase subunit E